MLWPEPRHFARTIWFFYLPLLGGLLTVGVVDLIVPRQEPDKVLEKIGKATITFGADVIAAYYYLAIAAVLVVVACAVSLWWSVTWLTKVALQAMAPRDRPLLWAGIAAAIALPALLLISQYILTPGCNRLEIDDCVTGMLFKLTIQRAYKAKFLFIWDANLLAYLVFTAYLFNAAVAAIAVGTAPPSTAKDKTDRMDVLNTVLFATTAVLLTAMLATKYRFDVGLATLGAAPTKEAPNIAFSAYQVTASAIMAYWATVLSLSLALIYLPGAYALSHSSPAATPIFFKSLFVPTEVNMMRLLKLAAIISPPVINKIVEILGSAPKGT